MRRVQLMILRKTSKLQLIAMNYYKSGLKINLSLKVVGRRSDNFHLLDSIFVPIDDIYDKIGLEIKKSDALKIDFSSNISNQKGFDGKNNLVVRAAELYCRSAGINAEIAIDLKKNIPIGGGVGGGSGNAGCVLTLLNEKFQTFDIEQLKVLALKLGADVPFFIEKKLARINGIGEKIMPFKSALDLYFVVIFPKFPVSTPWAFKNLPEELKKSDDLKRADKIFEGLEKGEFDLVYNNLHNDFESVLFEKYLAYSVLRNSVKPWKLSVSGSGSTCFVLCRNEAEQMAVYKHLATEFADENFVIEKAVYKK